MSSVDARERTATTPLPAPENRLHYPALDGLRAIAVLMVIWQHNLGEYYLGLRWGWAGVDIFFVLSGFLITGILYDTRHTAHRVRNFYMRRTLRIFPLYYGVPLVALLTTPIFHWYWNRAWVLWSLYLGNYVPLLFRHSPLQALGGNTGILVHLRSQPVTPYSASLLFGHFWTLCVEEQFYLVWPMVVFTIGSRVTLRNLCLLSVPVALAARIACAVLIPSSYVVGLLLEVTPLRCDAFLIGGFVALALRGPERVRLLQAAKPVLTVALVGFLVWQVIYHHFVGAFFHPVAESRVLFTIGLTFLDIAAAALLVSLLRLDNPLARLLTRAPLRYVGQISYGIYVFHDIFRLDIANALERMTGASVDSVANRSATGVLGLALTLLLAALSHRFFETPFLRLKSQFAPRLG